MLQCDYAFLNCRKIRTLIFDKCKYNDRFSGFRFFSLNVGEAMLSDCGRSKICCSDRWFPEKRESFRILSTLLHCLHLHTLTPFFEQTTWVFGMSGKRLNCVRDPFWQSSYAFQSFSKYDTLVIVRSLTLARYQL
jgi:hypothetical protein